MIGDYFVLAFRNLKHRGLRSWLTMLGIFIGIAALVSLISLGSGLQEAVTGQFGSLSVDKLTIQNKGAGYGAPGSTAFEALDDNDIEIIEGVNGVELVVPRLIRTLDVEYNNVGKFLYVADVPSEREKIDLIYDAINVEVGEGKLLQASDRGKVLVGSDLVDSSVFGKEIRLGKSIKIQGESFEVVGILEKSSTVLLNSIIIMPNADLEGLLDIDGEYDIIVAQIDDKDEIESIAEEIKRRLRKDRKEDVGKESFSVETPIQALDSVNSILGIINAIVVGIAAISLFVGGVGIMNTMYTSVIERTKEIGVMKAVGAQNKDVLTIFLIESGLLGLVGGIVGAAIGLSAALGVSGIANSYLGGDLFNISISYPLLIGSVLFSFFVGVLSGTLPAIQASKLNVIHAIRNK